MDPATYVAEDGLVDINGMRDLYFYEGSIFQCRGIPWQGGGSALCVCEHHGERGWDMVFPEGTLAKWIRFEI